MLALLISAIIQLDVVPSKLNAMITMLVPMIAVTLNLAANMITLNVMMIISVPRIVVIHP
jgi:hypothetical protein